MANPKVVPWLVFAGTETVLVDASTERGAFIAYLADRWPDHGDHGRIAPPTQDEVKIRRLNQTDADWITDSRDARFLKALARVQS